MESSYKFGRHESRTNPFPVDKVISVDSHLHVETPLLCASRRFCSIVLPCSVRSRILPQPGVYVPHATKGTKEKICCPFRELNLGHLNPDVDGRTQSLSYIGNPSYLPSMAGLNPSVIENPSSGVEGRTQSLSYRKSFISGVDGRTQSLSYINSYMIMLVPSSTRQ